VEYRLAGFAMHNERQAFECREIINCSSSRGR
jgi:hypothetical protein